ncbi:hypothetical protein Tco_0997388 [Tanacetum coccineum]
MKNLEDAYATGDQFINDKSTEDEPGKLNVEAEVVSMITVPIFQASSSVPPLSTPIIDLSPLEKKLSDLEQNNKNLDNTTQNLGSRVYTLELRDLPHKIDEAVRENVKEAVQIALQAPLRERFRDLSKEDMKEMLHQRMFESGTYKSLPEHIAPYEALEASMARAQRDPPDLDLTWKKSVTQDAPSSSSKQQSGPHAEQPLEDIPIPDSANISDSEDTNYAHLLKIKQRPEWLKPILDDERPATPEPSFVIPTSHIPDAKNNWANALASTYQAPAENSLLDKIGDMWTFMNWYFQKMGKTELTQAYLEGQENLKACMKSLKLSTQTSADYQEYTIAEKDFKNLYPIDFEDLNLLLLQGHLNHLSSSDKLVFPVSNNERKIMRFNGIYKFSDGMLTNILEAPHYRVKEYKVQVKMEMEIPHSSGVYFITACSYSTDTSKDLMKAQVYVSKLPQL